MPERCATWGCKAPATWNHLCYDIDGTGRSRWMYYCDRHYEPDREDYGVGVRLDESLTVGD